MRSKAKTSKTKRGEHEPNLVHEISDEEHRAHYQASQGKSRLSLRHLRIRLVSQEKRGSLKRNDNTQTQWAGVGGIDFASNEQ